ncbi:hypothetical protein [Herbaspirillum seropedicae]|uniref:hypothetical protein n=1 Tax=Herbaspirillum seropedicae TaxID=964 RepID=UPI003D985735
MTAANIGDLQWRVIFLINLPIVAVAFWRYEQALTQRGGTPLVSPRLAKVPRLVAGLAGALFFYVVSAFFLTFSIFLPAGASSRDPLLCRLFEVVQRRCHSSLPAPPP